MLKKNEVCCSIERKKKKKKAVEIKQKNKKQIWSNVSAMSDSWKVKQTKIYSLDFIFFAEHRHIYQDSVQKQFDSPKKQNPFFSISFFTECCTHTAYTYTLQSIDS